MNESEVVRFNVGGIEYNTTVKTLRVEKDTFFFNVSQSHWLGLEERVDGRVFVDRYICFFPVQPLSLSVLILFEETDQSFVKYYSIYEEKVYKKSLQLG